MEGWDRTDDLMMALAPIGAWLALPVTHEAGPIQVYATPSGFLSSTFIVKIENEGYEPQLLADLVEVRTSDSVALRSGLEHFSGSVIPFPRGSSRHMTITPGASLWLYPLKPGLHRIPVTVEPLAGSKAGTNIWVFSIGSKAFAIK